ncbi:MAG: endopeptidase La [Thermodesulfovibrionales bacterium]
MNMPEAVRDVVNREVDLLERIGPSTSEYTIGLGYLEYLLSLPWNVRTVDNLDIERAAQILDEHHYGLRQIKERILEYLAVKKLRETRKASILVVDDEEIVRRNMSHILGKEGYAVDTASNGAEAISRAVAKEYDVVLTDFKMEKIDGMDVLERIKIASPATQVIMITGYATVNTAVEAMRKGAFHYIAKPFKIDDVRSVVGQALEKRAVRKDTSGAILCFAGPPGTGKTSLGRSIARALGRKFVRISLGGVKDEAEIRGHRRTYAGAMPGRIVEEIRKAGSLNPVMILDELDKIGRDAKGDPSAALLEVLDREQNTRFTDHYLDLPLDLSDISFVITANVAESIPEPLRDRMEVIRFTGYTEEEKFHIARHFLVPRQIREAGLSDIPPDIADESLVKIIREYTHEAGIRGLNREIATICRKVATAHVRRLARTGKTAVTPDLVEKILGPRKYIVETAGDTDRVGVATGLVWTDVGGEIIFVEAVRMRGKQELILTGSLGGVMQESAQAALSYLRSNASRLGIPEDFFEGHDIHIHVPAGAIPKDGPSAGVTIALALLSLLSGRPARKDAAATGELTLSGRILPVGGVKEKVLAAKRAQVKTVVLPEGNRVDIGDLDARVVDGMEVRYAGNFDEVVGIVLRG